MKNLLWISILSIFVIGAFGISSCSHDESISPKASTQDHQSVDFRAGNQTVSGHVELDMPNEDFPEFRVFEKYSFNAVKHSDGSVTGQFQIYDNYPDYPSQLRIVVQGEVTCFTIQPDGKTAWLGGVVTNGDYIFEGEEYSVTGTDANWIVVDNGEGNNSLPDEASDLSFGFDPGTTAANNCANGDSPNYGYGPILRGNVKVKP